MPRNAASRPPRSCPFTYSILARFAADLTLCVGRRRNDTLDHMPRFLDCNGLQTRIRFHKDPLTPPLTACITSSPNNSRHTCSASGHGHDKCGPKPDSPSERLAVGSGIRGSHEGFPVLGSADSLRWTDLVDLAHLMASVSQSRRQGIACALLDL